MDLVGNWKLPDKYVNETYPYSPTCSSYRINYNLLQNTDHTSCWFVNGQGGVVSFGPSLRFSNGQFASIPAKGDFSVYKPTFSDFNGYPSIVGMTWDGIKLWGNMDWSVKVHSKYDGNVGVTQLLNGTTYYYNTGGKDYLDGDYEIYDGTAANPMGQPYRANDLSTHHVELRDTPNAPATPCVDLEATFKDYLRFRPSGPSNIFVTIGTNGWFMDGTACLWNGMTKSNLPPATPPIDSDIFPVWENIRHE